MQGGWTLFISKFFCLFDSSGHKLSFPASFWVEQDALQVDESFP